jgi:hypothetical protein
MRALANKTEMTEAAASNPKTISLYLWRERINAILDLAQAA